jgi:type IV fimbrial biogenesis protein FimT
VQGTPARSTGFGKIEILVTLAIAGTIVGITGPAVAPTVRLYEARAVQRMVYADLQRARSEAVTRNVPVTVGLGSTDTAIERHVDFDRDGVEDFGEIWLNDLGPSYSSARLTFSSSITFSPNGSASVPGTVTVEHPGGTTVIEVTAAGRIRVP